MALATFVAEHRSGGGSAESIVDSLRMDNDKVADFVDEMMLGVDDPEAKRLIATTAWVVYGAATLAFDPDGKAGKPQR